MMTPEARGRPELFGFEFKEVTSTQMTMNCHDFLIIADDFSGACEVSLPWSDQGFLTQVSLGPTSDLPCNAHGVIAIDTNSRYLKPEDAYRRIQELTQELPDSTMIFKKIDSLWRGNLNAELRALIDAGYQLIIAGALPHLERSVKNGRPLVSGRPLSSTDAWQVEAQSAPETVTDLLSDIDTATTALSATEPFQDQLSIALNSTSAIIVDCSTEDDLFIIADAWLTLSSTYPQRDQRSILVGTGALNAALVSNLGDRAKQPQDITQKPSVLPGESTPYILGVVGSASGSSGQQLENAQKAGIPCAETINELPAPKRGAPVILRATRSETNPTTVLQQLKNQATAFLSEHPRTDLFLTGGETARVVLDELGVTSLAPVKQLEPGVVICSTPDGRLIGTKPGSFGNPDILTTALTTLRELRASLSQEQ